MTTPLQSEPGLALDTVLHARAAGVAAGTTAPRRRSGPQLGRVLRVVTLAADAIALAFGLALVGVSPMISPFLILAWVGLLASWGAYRRGLAYPVGAEARAIFLGGLSGSLLVLQVGPSLGVAIERRGLVALLFPVALLVAGRVLLRIVGAWLRRHKELVCRVLLVGDGPDAVEVLENLEAWPGLGIEVIGVCADTTKSDFRGLPVLGLSRSCNVVARDLGLRTVILAPNALRTEDCSKIHGELLSSELEVILAPNMSHVGAGRLATRQLGGLAILRLDQRRGRARELSKRSFDVFASLLLLVLLAPLLVTVAVLIRLDSPGFAFFRQRRIGRSGAAFEVWKFRTMLNDAETLLADLQPGVAAGLFKLQDDPRVTRVGRSLRRTSLDELPQLWNVLIGEMSLVGPRPALPHEVADFDDLTLRRLRVRPGITGLWQVSGRSDASFKTYSRMDAFYADNWTFCGDLRILLRTIPVVCGGRGAY